MPTFVAETPQQPSISAQQPSTPTEIPVCPYQADNDANTIVNIIQAEAEASNSEDLSIIRVIFAPDALLRFEKKGSETEWRDPVGRYKEQFENYDISNSVHFDIKPVGRGITNDTAFLTSGSSGIWTPNGGKPEKFYNEPGKDYWILKKDNRGCWVIVEFRFY